VQTCIWPSGFHCHSLSLASVKSRLVLPFWYRPTRVVLDKGPLNGCVCVCVCVCVDIELSVISSWHQNLHLKALQNKLSIRAVSSFDSCPANDVRAHVTTDNAVAVNIICKALCDNP